MIVSKKHALQCMAGLAAAKIPTAHKPILALVSQATLVRSCPSLSGLGAAGGEAGGPDFQSLATPAVSTQQGQTAATSFQNLPLAGNL